MKRTYRVSLDTVVLWDSDKCWHCGKCITELPNVFGLNKQPWVNINGATEEEIRKQVLLCPSKALSLG